eukprot:TRINITY_DN5067_c0_g1_i3.p1 TRINITY_DN5067_c0_g1~~TRINITY_DN5067_c0_g1_i3.p1  ORF type:complete len:172 (+),score=25.46 TRINITY_DN5067_c0_g1_i3:1047-1562(+)
MASITPDFATLLNQTTLKDPTFLGVNFGGEVPTAIPALTVALFAARASTDHTNITDLTLDRSGFIFAIACLAPSNTPAPLQIKQGLDASNKPADSFGVAFYYNAPVTIQLLGLQQNKRYDFYMVSSNEDPSPAAIFGTPIKRQNRTLSISTTYAIALAASLLSVAAFALMI